MQVNEMVKVLRMEQSSVSGKLVQEFVAQLNKEHRTHQASVIKNLRNILILYAQTATSDERNKNAVEFAKKTTEIDIYIPYV